MGEGDDTLGHAAREVRRGAFMVRMVGRPAVPAAPMVGAVASFVSRVLAVTFEAVNVGRERSLALSKGTAGWSPWIFYCPSLKAVFPFTIFWFAIWGSLRGMNAGDDTARRGLGTSAKEVRDQARPDCCMRQVALHLVFLFFSFELLSP